MPRQYIRKHISQAQIRRFERAAMILRMINSGMNQNQVAGYLGISRQAVNQILYRHKLRARRSVYYALQTGELVKPDSCDVCLITSKLSAHHPDYTSHLSVQWLCEPCHVAADCKGRHLQ